MTNRKKSVLRLTYAAVCLALALVLPMLTGQIPQIGQALSPMHIPAFLCGFLCGWPWGLVVGAVAPLLRFAIFQMPPAPTCYFMAAELAAYGCFSGIFYRLLPKKIPFIYVSLVAAMVCGRAVDAVVKIVVANAFGVGQAALPVILTNTVVNTVPGIIVQIILVPAIIIALRKANLVPNE